MSKTRLWVIGAVAAMLVVVIAGYVLGISPVLTQASAASSQTTSIQASNQASQSQLATLKTQFGTLGTIKKKLTKLRLSIPEQQAASVYLNEITALSVSSGVTLQTATIASATLFQAAAAATGASLSSTANTTTATATPTAAPIAGATNPGAVVTATPSGLVLVPVTVAVKGNLAQVQAFDAAMQKGSRLFVASLLTLTTDTSSGSVLGTIQGDIFTLAGTSDPSPKTRLVPTPTATVTPSATATPTPTASTTTSGSTSGSTGGKTGGTTGGSTGPTTAPRTPPTTPSTPDPDPTP